jgi:hypothetical protein
VDPNRRRAALPHMRCRRRHRPLLRRAGGEDDHCIRVQPGQRAAADGAGSRQGRSKHVSAAGVVHAPRELQSAHPRPRAHRRSHASIAGGSGGAPGGQRRSAAARRLHPGRIQARREAPARRLRHRPPRRRVHGFIFGSELRGHNGGAVKPGSGATAAATRTRAAASSRLVFCRRSSCTRTRGRK